MTEHRIDLAPYDVKVGEQVIGLGPDGKTEIRADVTKPYDLRTTLVNILLHPTRQLGAREFLAACKLARQIGEGTGDLLALRDADYEEVLAAMEAFKGWARPDEEFIRRILGAPQVELLALAKE